MMINNDYLHLTSYFCKLIFTDALSLQVLNTSNEPSFVFAKSLLLLKRLLKPYQIQIIPSARLIYRIPSYDQTHVVFSVFSGTA